MTNTRHSVRMAKRTAIKKLTTTSSARPAITTVTTSNNSNHRNSYKLRHKRLEFRKASTPSVLKKKSKYLTYRRLAINAIEDAERDNDNNRNNNNRDETIDHQVATTKKSRRYNYQSISKIQKRIHQTYPTIFFNDRAIRKAVLDLHSEGELLTSKTKRMSFRKRRSPVPKTSTTPNKRTRTSPPISTTETNVVAAVYEVETSNAPPVPEVTAATTSPVAFADDGDVRDVFPVVANTDDEHRRGHGEVIRRLKDRDAVVTEKKGSVAVSLIWNHTDDGDDNVRNDLDLWVTAPSGERIGYSHKRSACGGELDVDRQQCAPEPVENIVWKDKAPVGTYEVRVHNFGSNHQRPKPFSVSIVTDGEHDRHEMVHMVMPAAVSSWMNVKTFEYK